MSVTSVTLKLETCKKCPYKESERWYSPDPWEYVLQWVCTKSDRVRPGHSEKTDVSDSSRIGFEGDGKSPTAIPQWCPLLKVSKNKKGR